MSSAACEHMKSEPTLNQSEDFIESHLDQHFSPDEEVLEEENEMENKQYDPVYQLVG